MSVSSVNDWQMSGSAHFTLLRAVAPLRGLPLNKPVALAGGVFQLAAVYDFQAPTAVSDSPGLLQNSGGYGHTGTSSAEHLSEKFLCQGQVIG